jgi:DNA-directed RNA polymerase subunit beta
VVPFVSADVEYLSADAEDKFVIAQANSVLNEHNEFEYDRISCRYHSDFIISSPDSVNYMDVAPNQVVGISAALIPFLEHDDANRALMGSNMQAQAVPLINPKFRPSRPAWKLSPPSTRARCWWLKKTAMSFR